jgi:hypothetical protein
LPPKDQGGLGIQDLEVKNAALLGKWLSRLLTEYRVLQKLLRQKYVASKALSQVLWKPGDSHFWARLMATKKHFFGHGKFSIKDGSDVRFWEDKWLGIRHCMLSSVIRVIQLPMFWSLILQM